MDQIFANDFENLTVDQACDLDDFFHGYDYDGATYSLLANLIWQAGYRIGWEEIAGYVVTGSVHQGEDAERYLRIPVPLTKEGGYDPARLAEAVNVMRERCSRAGLGIQMAPVPKKLVPALMEALPGQIRFVHDRDLDEYVYQKDRLITLSGRALHKKKNHLNYFLKTYSYETSRLTAADLDEILRITDLVREDRERSEKEQWDLAAEKNAIRRMIRFLNRPTVYTCGIRIDGRLCAYAIGERLSDDTVVEHFEKADTTYRGLYQAILSEFCKVLPEEIRFVNREEDMGVEGLRHAKLALRPDHFAMKYRGFFEKM